MGPTFLEFLRRPGVWVVALAVAAFLVLSWILRGSPLGQAAEESGAGEGHPGPARRDRAVASSVGGLILVALGGYVAIAVGVPWSIPLFIAGYGLVAFTVRRNRPYRHDSPTLHRVVVVSDTAMTASLLAGVLLIGNVLAFKYYERPIDLTRERSYSLASLTTNQLRSLQRPLKFTVFYTNQPMGTSGSRSCIRQLLDLYRAENPRRVSVEFSSPCRDPYAFDKLAQVASPRWP